MMCAKDKSADRPAGAKPEIGTGLARRATVEGLVAKRNQALTAYSAAHAGLVAAEALLIKAGESAQAVYPGEGRYNFHLDSEKKSFHLSITPHSHPDYMGFVRRMIDTDAWAYVIHITNLQNLMDKKAKDDFNQQLLKDPPEFTVDNVLATLQQFMLDSEMIFKRGIAECFSQLDRRFRSHDGWKIGSRIVLTYAFDSFSGGFGYHRNHSDSLMDIERVFRVLDENPANYCEVVTAVTNDRHGYKPQQSLTETQYFRVRGFKNGNAHVWFKRDDLVDRVNQLIGEYYGAPIPDHKTPQDDGGLYDQKTTPAKFYGFFPTPDAAVKFFLAKIPLLREKNEAGLRILEPSAGTGNLARACLAKPTSEDHVRHESYHMRHRVECVEIQPDLADGLRTEGFAKVYTANFLQLSPETTGLYDRVIMNPPFDRERDIDHVMHALEFLKSDGFLAAIMSAGTEFRDTRKSKAFRDLMNKMGAEWIDMPKGSFSEAGTNCNTGALYVWKNGTDKGRWSRKAFEEGAQTA